MTTRTLDLDKLHLLTGSHDPNDEQRMCVMERPRLPRRGGLWRVVLTPEQWATYHRETL